MFLEYECGCVGIKTAHHVVLVKACDRDFNDNEIGFFITDRMGKKASKLLTRSEEVKLVNEIGYLINCGYTLNMVRTLLALRS